MTAKPKPKTRPVSDPVWRALEGVHGRVSRIEHALAPAFSPRKDDTMSRGPGDHRPEPFIMRQASTTSGDIWAGDVEHSPAYMDAIRNGTSLPELRRLSADDAVMRSRRDQPSPLMWTTRDGQAVMDGSLHRPPEQRSVTHHEWTDFPDHQPAPPASNAEPADFLVARQQAAQMPARPPEGPVMRGL